MPTPSSSHEAAADLNLLGRQRRRDFSLSAERRRRSPSPNDIPDLTFSTRYKQELHLWVDRERARFSTWYELFPRSTSPDPARHGTFADVEALLAQHRRHGLRRPLPAADPPHRHRLSQGPQQRRRPPTPDDPGSPWAIGADRRRSQSRSIPSSARSTTSIASSPRRASYGIEIALDIAFQCSPDHPWVTRASRVVPPPPGRHRSSTPRTRPRNIRTSIRSTSNHPTGAGCGRALQTSSCSGSSAACASSASTTPTPSRSLLGVVHRARSQANTPTSIFLAEAFTRPHVMYRLAKLGFTQSYTYFTWRNASTSSASTSTELTQPPVRRLLPAEPLAEHARHPARDAAERRPAGLHAAPDARRHARRKLRHLRPGLRAVRERPASSPAAKSISTSEKYEIRHWDLHRARQPRAADHAGQPDPPRQPRPAERRLAPLPRHRQPEHLATARSTSATTASSSPSTSIPPRTQAGWIDLDLEDSRSPHNPPSRSKTFSPACTTPGTIAELRRPQSRRHARPHLPLNPPHARLHSTSRTKPKPEPEDIE